MSDLIGQWLSYPATDARILSMLGIGVHWAILQFTLGLPLYAVIFEYLSQRFGNDSFKRMSRTFSKVMVMIFPVGAVTGTLAEFGLALIWPNLLVIVGKYFFFPLYLEVFAFITEAIFIYMYYYTWDTVKPRFHLAIGILVAFGAALSAVMIVSTNNLMNIPPGINIHYDPSTGTWTEPSFTLYIPGTGWATLTYTQVRDVMLHDPNTFHSVLKATVEQIGVTGIVFLVPGALASSLHAIFSAYTTVGFTIMGAYSYRYITARNSEEKTYYLNGLKLVTLISAIVIAIQGFIIGDLMGKTVAMYNPEKFAAIEGTSKDIFSLTEALGLHPIIAWLSYGDPNAILPNYDAIPAEFRPPLIIHYVYYIKIGLALLLGLDALLMVFLWYILKKDVPEWLIKLNILAPFIVMFVSMLGWGVRELGRKPFSVYALLKVNEAVTPIGLPGWIYAGVALYIILVGFGLLGFILYTLRRRD